MTIEWEFKNIRDPIHGFVGVTERELKLLDTYPMQRLRRIKQLACADLVYPGAVHTRFEHSIGTLYVADKMAERITLADHEKEVIRCASLLHDMGHGPFSHGFEAILSIANQARVGHEDITVALMKEVPEISDTLGDLYDDVLKLFVDTQIDSASKMILSSEIDADKLDYLQRDSYHVGVTYGLFDFKRVLLTLSKSEADSGSRLVILQKGVDAIENFRLAKLSMHKQVYQHHVRTITDAMIMRMGELALKNKVIPASIVEIPLRSDGIEKFLSTDDVSFLKDMSEEEGFVSEFAERLLRRDLLKVGFEIPMEDIDSIKRANFLEDWGPERTKREKFAKIENEIAETVDIDPEYIIIYIREIENILASSFRSKLLSKHPLLHIKMKDGKHKPFDDLTSIRGRSEAEYTLLVFCPKEVRDAVRECSWDILM